VVRGARGVRAETEKACGAVEVKNHMDARSIIGGGNATGADGR